MTRIAVRSLEKGQRQLEHQDSPDCWCCPRLSYQDPVTLVCTWLHYEREDAN